MTLCACPARAVAAERRADTNSEAAWSPRPQNRVRALQNEAGLRSVHNAPLQSVRGALKGQLRAGRKVGRIAQPVSSPAF